MRGRLWWSWGCWRWWLWWWSGWLGGCLILVERVAGRRPQSETRPAAAALLASAVSPDALSEPGRTDPHRRPSPSAGISRGGSPPVSTVTRAAVLRRNPGPPNIRALATEPDGHPACPATVDGPPEDTTHPLMWWPTLRPTWRLKPGCGR